MSESFENVMDYASAVMADCDIPLLDRLKIAHDHEIEQMRKEIAARYELTHCPACETRLKKLDVQYEVEHASRESFHRGYLAGQKSMDADHAAVAMKLRGLSFDGGSHENLNKVAYAIYPCATGWTVESCEGLRDKIIDLLGGVHECGADCGGCGAGCDCADSGGGEQEEVDVDDSVSDVRANVPTADGLADSSFTQVMYDELSNERHKAVCRLREWAPDEDGMPRRKLWEAVMGEEMPTVPLKGDAELDIIMRDRLIHLLGGDEPYSNLTRTILEPNLSKSAETIKSGDECENKLMENDENHKIATITDELREWMDLVLTADDQAWDIADRIDEQAKQLERQRDELQAKLDEADAAIANYREREKSFAESERQREELQKLLDEMQEQREHWADEATKMYRLFFSHDEYCVPDSPSEMVTVAVRTLQEKYDGARGAIRHLTGQWSKAVKQRKELQAKLDAIREALDEQG